METPVVSVPPYCASLERCSESVDIYTFWATFFVWYSHTGIGIALRWGCMLLWNTFSMGSALVFLVKFYTFWATSFLGSFLSRRASNHTKQTSFLEAFPPFFFNPWSELSQIYIYFYFKSEIYFLRSDWGIFFSARGFLSLYVYQDFYWGRRSMNFYKSNIRFPIFASGNFPFSVGFTIMARRISQSQSAFR